MAEIAVREMPVLLIPSGEDPERDAVAEAWSQRGWEVCRLARFWDPPELPAARAKLYGGETFCLVLAGKLGLELVSPPDDLLATADPIWLKRHLERMPLSEALTRPCPLFVKPVVPKIFRSAVYTDVGQLAQESAGLEPETAVLASEPVTFVCEARCLVLHGRVVSVAVYEGVGSTREAREFAESFLARNDLPVTVALDVGHIAGRGWALIEANAIWGAGLNGCDADRMVDCLVVATRPRR